MSGAVAIEASAQLVAQEVGKRLGAHDTDRGPQVFPGTHEGSRAPFVVSWEEGPFQWTYRYDLLYVLSEELGVYLEPVNHFAVSVFPM